MSSNSENNNSEISNQDEAVVSVDERESTVPEDTPESEVSESQDSAVAFEDSSATAMADLEIQAGAAVAVLAAEFAAEFAAEESMTEGPHLSIVPVVELSAEHVRNVLEAALFAADEALTVDRLFKLFAAGELAEENGRAQIRDALAELEAACENRGFELKKVASGYRMQVRQNLSPWVSRLWEEKPPRYTRALLETMALIAYKQPATRGDIEEVRGVAVSSSIMRTLLERGWIREVGQRDVPGRPSMYGTTKEFLDYFNLSSLDQLPSLPEIRELVEPAQIPDEPVVEVVEEVSNTPDAPADPQNEVDDLADEDGDIRSDQSEVQIEESDDAPDTDDAVTDEAVLDTIAEGADDAVDEESAQAEAGEELGEELKGVDMPTGSSETGLESNRGGNTGTAPVFADNEVLVVDESASVEVQHTSDLATLPSADSQE